ncbi:MAG: hypothetical protein RBS38_04550 [Bacteroidales bacterium]|jgi:hypothetical protein|nr:hypothetical protein [Bacteroidales bacterium]
MRKAILTLQVLMLAFSGNEALSTEMFSAAGDTAKISGQASAWINGNQNNDFSFASGIRYIPSAYYGVRSGGNKLIDFEASANIFGSIIAGPSLETNTEARIKPYRMWARYSSDQFELRLGLQKINFGSASMIRPLMWFDQMDPRDPLRLTDGVWGLLGRYYFLNNANIWLWGLYGNHDPRAWEILPSNKKIPEFGGRIQLPVPAGEAGFSYHHRNADTRGTMFPGEQDRIPEDRFGLDARWDLVTGLWVEGSWTRKRIYMGTLTNQEIINAGADYTFGLGNGLYVAYEHLVTSYDQKPFGFTNLTTFSLATLSYPVGMFDKVSAIIYYDWTNSKIYNFASWEKQYDNFMIYVMGYLNPRVYNLPAQTGPGSLFSGSGIQVMLVFNH